MDWIRKSAVAGRFYPEDCEEVESLLQQYFSQPPGESKATPLGVMAPHAGYMYSGKIAGAVYRRLDPPRHAVILCPNHTGMGMPFSVWGKGSWRTPLGSAVVDEALAENLLNLTGDSSDREAHLFEHAIETHIPFLQWMNPDVSIVPVVMGPLSLNDCLRVGEALSQLKASDGTRPLLIASTDMSHFISASQAEKQDEFALKCFRDRDPQGLYEAVVEKDISMCGFIPTVSVLHACNLLGAKEAEVLSYGHSGEVSGDKSSVVAYAAGWIH